MIARTMNEFTSVNVNHHWVLLGHASVGLYQASSKDKNIIENLDSYIIAYIERRKIIFRVNFCLAGWFHPSFDITYVNIETLVSILRYSIF